MKTTLTQTIVYLGAFFYIAFPLIANPFFTNEDLSANLWNRSEGFDVAMVLAKKEESSNQTRTLNVYVKNELGSMIYFDPNFGTYGVKIFYIDGHGHQASLRSYSSALISESALTLITMKPGSTLLVAIKLTPSEFSLISKYTVKYAFAVLDPVTKKYSVIYSSPKKLTE